MIDCVLEMKVGIVHFDLQALSTPPSVLRVCSRMPQYANLSYAKAAKLCLSGPGWDGALKEAAIPDTDLARSSVRRAIRKLEAEAKAKAEAKAGQGQGRPMPRPRPCLPGLCSAHGGAPGHEQRGMEQHESPRGGRQRPESPLWCGCCSSPTPVLGAVALEST